MFLQKAVEDYQSAYKYASPPAISSWQMLTGKPAKPVTITSSWKWIPGNVVMPPRTDGLGVRITPKNNPNFPGYEYKDPTPVTITSPSQLGDFFSEIGKVIPDVQTSVDQLQTALKVITILSGVAAATGVLGLIIKR